MTSGSATAPRFYEKHASKLATFLHDNGLADTPWIYVPDEWKQSPPSGIEVNRHLNPQIFDLARFQNIGVVVSTSPTAHKPYLDWALDRGFHVLADKPLTVPAGVAVDDSQAIRILIDYNQLQYDSQRKKLLFMLAAQKRYDERLHRAREAYLLHPSEWRTR